MKVNRGMPLAIRQALIAVGSDRWNPRQRLRLSIWRIVGAHDGDPDAVYLGGRDAELITTIEQRLQQAEFKTKDNGHKFPGIKKSNIVNRGATGKGAQLELPLSLRKVLAKEPALLEKFKDALREAIHALDAEPPAQPAAADRSSKRST